jgi:TfoX/Sxy family transcriptional regulator of competence genes
MLLQMGLINLHVMLFDIAIFVKISSRKPMFALWAKATLYLRVCHETARYSESKERHGLHRFQVC